MNWTDEEIDKLFQESASQMNAPAFQDSFWNEMEALLPQKEKKKGFGWIFGGTLASFALIAAMVFPGSQFSGKGRSTTASRTTAAPQQQAPSAAVLTSNSTTETANTAGTAIASVSAQGNNTAFTAAGERKVESTVLVAGDNVSASQTMVEPSTTTEPALQAETAVATTEAENVSRLPLLAFEGDAQKLAPSRFGKYGFRAPKNTFYAQAGFGMMQSYIAGTDKNWMPTFHIGGGYQYKPQGFGFSAGVNISGSFSNNLEITRRSKIYNFSSTSYQQNLMYKQLYAVELPLSVDFRKNRHTVSVGIAPTYLVTSLMRFDQYKDDQLNETGTYIGQREGLNSFGLKPSIAYQLEVARSWNVGIQLNAQVMKQVDETQFVGNLTKLPLSGQITIRKTLTR